MLSECCVLHFVLCFLISHFYVFDVTADEREYRLTKFLMKDYDPSIRPAENSLNPLEVSFGVSLHHIIDVDEKNQILTTNCWLTQIWIDHHLKWNVTDFQGIKVIRIPYFKVWRPDIILYNNADAQYNSAVINTNVIVTADGEVTWLSHGIYRSSCDIDVEYFPFDIQSCTMKWASWTYDGYQLDLMKEREEGDTTNYQVNGEFDLISYNSVKNVVNYSCCVEPYPDITYYISLRRRPMFYVFNLILPCILINCIALLVFYVPSESGEKVTLGISALLSMTVFLMTIRETLPPTEKTPLISMYYGVSICLVSFASGLSVVTLNIYHRGVRGTQVPTLVKALVLGKLAKFLLLEFESRDSRERSSIYQPQAAPHAKVKRPAGGRVDCSTRAGKWISEDGDCNSTPDPRTMSPRFVPRQKTHYVNGIHVTDSESSNLFRLLNQVHHTIERNETRLSDQERREFNELEWKQVALVCDRFLLWVFLITTGVTTYVILCGSPYGP